VTGPALGCRGGGSRSHRPQQPGQLDDQLTGDVDTLARMVQFLRVTPFLMAMLRAPE